MEVSFGAPGLAKRLPGQGNCQQKAEGRDVMYRSVIESEQEGSERRRVWRWIEGIVVAVVVVVGVTYLFGLINF